MKEIGAFEAKTHFSQLLIKVLDGEKFLITRHGQKVAMLVPLVEPLKQNVIQDPTLHAIQTIKAFRKRHSLGADLSIKSMREEGRR